jgi:hypothetical protein
MTIYYLFSFEKDKFFFLSINLIYLIDSFIIILNLNIKNLK